MSKYTAWPTNQHEEIRTRIAAHREADEIVQGIGWDSGKGRGCAIGCSLNEYCHEEYARVLGVPLAVARLVDTIHEGLTSKESLDWPMRVAMALTPGSAATHGWSRFAIWLLRKGLPLSGKKNGVIDAIVSLFEQRVANCELIPEDWQAAISVTETEIRCSEASCIEDRSTGTISTSRTVPVFMVLKMAVLVADAGKYECIGREYAASLSARSAVHAADLFIPYQSQADELIAILSSCK